MLITLTTITHTALISTYFFIFQLIFFYGLIYGKKVRFELDKLESFFKLPASNVYFQMFSCISICGRKML